MSHINVTHVKQMCKLSLCKAFRNKIYSNIHCGIFAFPRAGNKMI